MKNRDCDSANDGYNIRYSDTRTNRYKDQITDDYEFLENYDFMSHLESSGQLRQYRNNTKTEDSEDEINIDLNFMEDPSFYHDVQYFDKLNKTLEQELYELDGSLTSVSSDEKRREVDRSQIHQGVALRRKWYIVVCSIATMVLLMVTTYLVTDVFTSNEDAYALEPVATILTTKQNSESAVSEVIKAETTTKSESAEKVEQGKDSKQEPKTTNKPVVSTDNEASKDEQDKEFEDSVFIGNSLVVGLRQTCKMPGATFLACQSLDISDAFDKAFVVDRKAGKKLTILEALQKKQYKKVYLLFGINELGWPYPDAFISKYKKFIKKIKTIQPDAEIYVQSIFPVTKDCSDNKEVFTKKNIVKRNKLLKKMCSSKDVVYLDVYSALSDKNGYLPEKNSTDGIHLKKAGYKEWLAYVQKMCKK